MNIMRDLKAIVLKSAKLLALVSCYFSLQTVSESGLSAYKSSIWTTFGAFRQLIVLLHTILDYDNTKVFYLTYLYLY